MNHIGVVAYAYVASFRQKAGLAKNDGKNSEEDGKPAVSGGNGSGVERDEDSEKDSKEWQEAAGNGSDRSDSRQPGSYENGPVGLDEFMFALVGIL